MIWWILLAVPLTLLTVALVHDFLAGLGEDRLWSDPALDDPDSAPRRVADRRASRFPVISIDSAVKESRPASAEHSGLDEKRARPA